MWWLPWVITVLLQGNINGVTSVLSPSRCNVTIKKEQFHTPSCLLCRLNVLAQCPAGSVKLTTGMGIRNCILVLQTGWIPFRMHGCVHICERKIVKSNCCSGHWGKDCLPCPGLKNSKNACYGNGNCSDLITGDGKCHCDDGFEGFACEKCFNKKKFGIKCQKRCTCQNGICSSGVTGKGTCLPYTCQIGYHGENCNIFEQRCNKTCHKHSHCIANQIAKPSCNCNPGYSGNGNHCEAIDPCKKSKNLCPSNSDCRYKGPGRYECACSDGYTGDGIVCTAIDHCLYNNGNCSNNTKCNFQGPGKYNCSCLPGYDNHVRGKGCTIVNLCLPADCPDINGECYMVYPGLKNCRCKSGYVGNGTVCYGNIVQRIGDLNRQEQYKNKLRMSLRLIHRHGTLIRPLSGAGPFTVFILTNDGLRKNLTTAQRLQILNDADLALDILLVHLVAGYLTTSELTKNGNLTTLKGLDAIVTNNSNFFYQLRGHSMKSKIITTDVIASNGIIHILELPAWIPDFSNIQNTSSLTIWQVIIQKPELQTLRQFIEIAGMRPEFETASIEGITFVAPTNEAFNALNSNTTEFLKSSKGTVKLQAILRNHIFEKRIGITEMIYKPNLQSRAPALVNVYVKDQGAVILGKTAKLVETNIPTSNGILFISNGLLVPSFVKPIIQKRCDVNSSSIVYSPCNFCSRMFINGNCPSSTVSTGKTIRCYLRLSFGIFGARVFPGCKTRCTPVVKHCCPGFYGPNCLPCPGSIGQPCYGNGKCFDDIKGDGTCVCNSSFTGTACELCKYTTTFGLTCGNKCTCVHGICNAGRQGNGSCLPHTCSNGYFGNDCATFMRPCGFLKSIPCSVHSQCRNTKGGPRCVCNSGYRGDGANCYEIDPCKDIKRGGCHQNAVCKKTDPGRSSCTCGNGWTGDGTYCSPLDFCSTPPGGICHKNAKCIFLGPGKIDCKCRPGYQGDGMSCHEIKSCLINHGNCSPFAKCITLGPGLNDCKCTFGYIGSGYICLPSMAVVIMNRKELKTMYHLASKSNLLRELASPNTNSTIFVPSDNAMSKLNASFMHMLSVPKYFFYFGESNMAQGFYYAATLKNLTYLPTRYSNVFINLSVSDTGQVLIGGVAKIIVANLTASNGIIHIVDTVLLPSFVHGQPPKEVNLYDRLCNQQNFSQMCYFIKKYKLESKLKSCDYCTIFVPSDNTFHELSTAEHNNFSLKDVQYHITEHYILPSTIGDGQQFSTLAGQYYKLLLETTNVTHTVNEFPLKYVDSAYRWVIYSISSVLKPVENVCFKMMTHSLKLDCRSCLSRQTCPPGYAHVGNERCPYLIFTNFVNIGCRLVCVKPVKVSECCPGFWGKFCDACPGVNGKPCSGNGRCSGTVNGTGVCNCDGPFASTACEKCKDGLYGENCMSRCNCTNGGTCDWKNGFCFCPPKWKGRKCELNAATTKCGNNTTCHQYASCNKANNTCLCDPGFSGNGTNCSHLHLCEENNGGCSPNAKCNFDAPLGNITCKCEPNYDGDGVYCQGTNPCRKNNNCHSKANCINLRPGRSKCTCRIGYSGDGLRSCTPFDPCSENNGGCSFFAKCTFNDVKLAVTCKCLDGYIGNGTVCTGNLMETLQTTPELTEFFSRVPNSILQEIFSPDKYLSIIAPTNNAFTSSSRRKRRSVMDLSEIDLKYYIVGCVYITKDDVQTSGKSFVSVAGSWLNITSPMVINNNINILSVQETVQGGVLIVDKMINASVKSLSNSNMSFIDAARNNGYGKFVQIIIDAGLRDIVSNLHYRPFTMFWPTDEAVNQLPADIKERLLSGNYNSETRKILDYHVISKTKITTKDILSYSSHGLSRRTQEGASLYISCKGQQGDLYINDRVKIIQRDIPLQEGIAFGISKVLLPPGVAGRCDEIKYETVKGPCVVCNETGVCPQGTILQNVDQTSSCVTKTKDKYFGCTSTCLRRTMLKKCCKNFYGQDCQACPGDVGNPCKGRGHCESGLNGTGVCLCVKPNYGYACERCNSTNCANVSSTCFGRHNPCSMFAFCGATQDKLCQCMTGYKGDGFYCQEFDPCQENNGDCSEHAICTYLAPNSSSCRCRPGYVGDGLSCSALPSSNPCATNNGNCHIHAKCTEKNGNPFCTCRKNFFGDGVFCGGNLMQVIYDTEDLSKFAKVFRNLAYGVEGSRIIRMLSSEAEFTVFAPINYGFTVQKMTIEELKNHIVEKNHSLTSPAKQTFLSLASNNITVLKSKPFRVNDIASILGVYPAINGIIHVIDHVIPYIKPHKTPVTNKPPTRTNTSHTIIPKKHGNNNHLKAIGISVGAIAFVVLLIVVLIFVKKRHHTSGVRYNKNFESVLFESEPYPEDCNMDEDEYEHPQLQHPSTEEDCDKGTCLTNPTYDDTLRSSDEHLDMTETSSIVPLTEHDILDDRNC